MQPFLAKHGGGHVIWNQRM